MQRQSIFIVSLNCLLLLSLAGCGDGDGGGGGGDSGPDTYSCPRWGVGDSMSYLRTTTVGNLSSTTTESFVVTEHTQDGVTLWDGTVMRNYSITADGRYLDGESNLPYCPPPAVGEKAVGGAEWVPGPLEGTGEWVVQTWSVTDVSIKSVSVPAGEFTAKEIVLKWTSSVSVPELPDVTVTQYYVGGIGIVKEVKVTPTTNTTITDELIAHSLGLMD